VLSYRDAEVKAFEPELTPPQRQILQLVDAPTAACEQRG
jgi:hypothetical protein